MLKKLYTEQGAVLEVEYRIIYTKYSIDRYIDANFTFRPMLSNRCNKN